MKVVIGLMLIATATSGVVRAERYVIDPDESEAVVRLDRAGLARAVCRATSALNPTARRWGPCATATRLG